MGLPHPSTSAFVLILLAISCYPQAARSRQFPRAHHRQHQQHYHKVIPTRHLSQSFRLSSKYKAAFSCIFSGWIGNSKPMKRDSPSAQRNKQVVWDVIQSKIQPASSTKGPYRVLEIAAGSGVHTSFFATQLSQQTKQPFLWFPTDADADMMSSLEAYRQELETDCVQQPMVLTLNKDGIVEAETIATVFPDSATVDLIICINMIHISPWEATQGLMKLAGERLSPGGHLYCYGPYKVGGTAVESNLRFDASLKSRNAAWGVRDLETVLETAESNGLRMVEKVEMPANNLSLIYTPAKKG
mmetsp:Transcript_12614/g.34752  ORF Transcript_12614/g.34752 Transcript_12614/m.34752 type:complete len:300 (+) Transcript_12614:97-996(+)